MSGVARAARALPGGPLRLAVPRGALFESTLDRLDAVGVDTSELRSDSRSLVFQTADLVLVTIANREVDDPIVLGPPQTRRWSYAASKYYDEHLALRMAEEEGLKVTILRFFNAYGARNHPSWWGGPLSVFFEDLLDGKEMELHGDGRQTRSFTFVSDTVDGVVRALARPESSGEVINIGNDQPIEIVELARKVQDAMGIEGPLRARKVAFESMGGNYQDVKHRVPDLSKARRVLGFEPAVPLEEGLQRTLQWHLALRGTALKAA